jgi:DNA-binding transcriptional LysR family regulator
MTPTPAGQRLAEQMQTIMAEYEQARRAERIAAGADPDEDRDPFETVRAIADDWAATAADTDGRAALLDHLADTLDTSQARALRLAAEAAAAVTPRLIRADADAGVRPADTATDLGVTESYVYRILREQRAAEPDAPITGDAPPVDEHRMSTRDDDQ